MSRLQRVSNFIAESFKELWGVFGTSNTTIQQSSPLIIADVISYKVSCVERISTPCRWSHLVAFGTALVTSSGTRKELAFWHKPAGPASWSLTSKTLLGEGVSQIIVWNLNCPLQQMLVVGTWEGSIFVLDSNGNKIVYEVKAHTDCVIAMCIWNQSLVTADINGIIKIWKLDLRCTSLSMVRSLEHSSKIYALLAVHNEEYSRIWGAGYSVATWDHDFHKTNLQNALQRNLVTSLCKWKTG